MSFWQSLDYYHWLLLGLLLLVIELLAGGGFLLWIGFAALVTGLLVLVLPWFQIALSWEGQLLLFIASCVVAVGCWRKYFRWRLATPTLEVDPESLIGREACLEDAIEQGRGQVSIDGRQWQVAGPDLPVGTRVRVMHVDGDILVVEAMI
jgi:membrane protein implicated in regulation of membrane protease activity